jgi:uncharacterized SAM-binding protein YcdF (DUF218 family)
MLYLVANHLLNPFLMLVLLITVLQFSVWRRPTEHSRRTKLLTGLIAGLYLYSTPAFAHLFLGTLEWKYPPLLQRPADAQAIVALSGGIHPPDDVKPRARLGSSTLKRCIRAAELYHEGPPCKVILTGGKVDPDRLGPTLAVAMREFLLDLGIPENDILIEQQSRSTYENALMTAPLLKENNLNSILLVTDATHLRRSVRCFEALGIKVVPAGCCYRSTTFRWSPFNFLPSVSAVQSNQEAFHEWVGLAWYKLRGHI